MFMDEARLSGLVQHPNVVSIVDVGEDDDGPFHRRGAPAGKIIAAAAEDGALPLVQLCARLAWEAARGPHAAHEAQGPGAEPGAGAARGGERRP